MNDFLNKKIKYNVFLLFILINYLGCGSVSQESVLLQNVKDAKMNSLELAIRMNEIGSRYSLEIENSADKIISEAADIKIKKNALLWKLYGIPALLKAISIRDPLISGLDTYTLIVQMRQFFESGNGRELFGKQQQTAIDAVGRMEAEFFEVASDFRDSALVTKYKVDDWAVNHPIENISFNRMSIVAVAAKELSQAELGLGSTVGEMATSINNLQDKLTLYADFLPKQARWQAEYLLYELLPDSLKGKIFNNIDSLTANFGALGRTIEDFPELISSIQGKLMQDINMQRIATIEAFREDRKIILESITSERIDLLKEVNRERLETLGSIDKLTEKSINSSGLMLVDVADKMMIRVILILFITFMFALILSWFLKRQKST